MLDSEKSNQCLSFDPQQSFKSSNGTAVAVAKHPRGPIALATERTSTSLVSR
jgi:hypothetical protein